MNRRSTGLLVAVAAAVAAVSSTVIVLLRAEKPRRYLQARFEQLRGVLPRPKQVRQSAQRLAARVSRRTRDAKGTTGQAMNKVKQTGSDLAEKAKQLVAVGNQDRR